MGLTLIDAANHTNKPLMAGIAKAIATTDEMAAMLDFKPVPGLAHSYKREKAIPGAEWVPDSGATTEESTVGVDRVTVPLRRIMGSMDFDLMAEDLESRDGVNQRAFQVEAKAKGLWNVMAQALITSGHVTSHTLSPAVAAITAMTYGPHLDSARSGVGLIKYTNVGQLWQFRAPGDEFFGTAVPATVNGTYTLKSFNPSKWIRVTINTAAIAADTITVIEFSGGANPAPDGLNRLIDPAMQFDSTGADGDAFSFALLDRLIDEVKTGGERAFVMHSQLLRRFYELTRSMGGTDPQTIAIPGYNGQVPIYRGFKLLRNDYIPRTEAKGARTDLTSIYFGSFREADGGLYVAAGGGSTFDVDADPRRTTVLGFRLDNVGIKETADVRRERMKWYGAFALKSVLGFARVKEVQPS